jgi:hypothetical protein
MQKEWKEYSGPNYEHASFEVCDLYKNSEGFLKFQMIDAEGSDDTYHSEPKLKENEWVLIDSSKKSNSGSSKNSRLF